ncbi:MAG TPA: bifunctional phosphoglucose/phosphomannose isomerase [Candidatus Saccharimonadales bacterium]|nr:bifunctional phosphoglucose/phosphomannose isomerase [Candidatus Saccharimonadales bacterium]
MLDDLKLIHERDPQDAVGVAGKQWEFLSRDFDVHFTPKGDIANVVIAGMGGSGWPAFTLGSWPRLKVPFQVVSNYVLPDYVNEKTLVISSSYSGNTEETLSDLEDAEKRGAQIAVVASGGKLADAARQKNLPLFALQAGIQPRMATLFFLNAYVKILSQAGLTVESPEELADAGEWLHQEFASLGVEVPTSKNLAKQIALELVGKTIIVYSGPLLYPAAHKWKICMNENAKNTAWDAYYPEFNHNEFIGWSGQPLDKPFSVVEIRSNLELPRTQKRFEVSERLLSGKRPAPIVVQPHGDTLLKQLLWSIAMGDFVSVYLAILNNVNPTPVDLVEKFKVELDK